MSRTGNRQRDDNGRLLPGERTDLSRYAGGDRDQAARAAHTADVKARRSAARRAAGAIPPDGERLTVNISFRVSEATGVLLDALGGSRNAAARDILRAAL